MGANLDAVTVHAFVLVIAGGAFILVPPVVRCPLVQLEHVAISCDLCDDAGAGDGKAFEVSVLDAGLWDLGRQGDLPIDEQVVWENAFSACGLAGANGAHHGKDDGSSLAEIVDFLGGDFPDPEGYAGAVDEECVFLSVSFGDFFAVVDLKDSGVVKRLWEDNAGGYQWACYVAHACFI